MKVHVEMVFHGNLVLHQNIVQWVCDFGTAYDVQSFLYMSLNCQEYHYFVDGEKFPRLADVGTVAVLVARNGNMMGEPGNDLVCNEKYM